MLFIFDQNLFSFYRQIIFNFSTILLTKIDTSRSGLACVSRSYKPGMKYVSDNRDIPVYWDHINKPLIFDGVSMTNLVEIHEFKKLCDIQIIYQ